MLTEPLLARELRDAAPKPAPNCWRRLKSGLHAGKWYHDYMPKGALAIAVGKGKVSLEKPAPEDIVLSDAYAHAEGERDHSRRPSETIAEEVAAAQAELREAAAAEAETKAQETADGVLLEPAPKAKPKTRRKRKTTRRKKAAPKPAPAEPADEPTDTPEE